MTHNGKKILLSGVFVVQLQIVCGKGPRDPSLQSESHNQNDGCRQRCKENDASSRAGRCLALVGIEGDDDAGDSGKVSQIHSFFDKPCFVQFAGRFAMARETIVFNFKRCCVAKYLFVFVFVQGVVFADVLRVEKI